MPKIELASGERVHIPVAPLRFPLTPPRQPSGVAPPVASSDYAFQIRPFLGVPGFLDGLYVCDTDAAGVWGWRKLTIIGGALSLGSLTVSGNVVVGGDLSVDDITADDVVCDTLLASSATLSGDLVLDDITGDVASFTAVSATSAVFGTATVGGTAIHAALTGTRVFDLPSIPAGGADRVHHSRDGRGAGRRGGLGAARGVADGAGGRVAGQRRRHGDGARHQHPRIGPGPGQRHLSRRDRALGAFAMAITPTTRATVPTINVPYVAMILDLDGGGEKVWKFPRALDGPWGELVNVQNIGAWPPKQIIGDFREIDHTLLSSLVQNNWSGGGQITNSQETDDVDRYWSLARMETRFPFSLTHLPLSRSAIGPVAGAPRIVGELVVGGVRKLYASFGPTLQQVSGTTFLGPTHDLTDIPSAGSNPTFTVGGVPKLMIPLGSSGYATFDGNTVQHYTTIQPTNFCVSSRKLWTIDAQGRIWKSLDGLAWTNLLNIDPGEDVRGCIEYFDRGDVPAMHFITDRMAWALDEAVPAVYTTELNYAPHPYSGLSFEVFRTNLYVSIGLGVQEYNLSTVHAAGIDRDDGLDKSHTGYFSAMTKGFNDLFGGISATVIPGGEDETLLMDFDPQVYISSNSPRCSINRLGGSQSWHTAWMAPTPGGEIKDVFVSTEGGHYRLYWTWLGRLWHQNLSVGFDNPRDNPNAEFEDTGELTSSWFDMNMATNPMTFLMLESSMNDAAAGDVVGLYYQIDHEDQTDVWHHVSDLTAIGDFKDRIGPHGTDPDGNTLYIGEDFRRLRYQIRSSRADATNITHTPDFRKIAISFLKRMSTTESFDVAINCSNPAFNEQWGLSNKERRQVLRDLVSKGQLTPVLFGDEWRTVRLSTAGAPQAPGKDSRGDVTLNFVDPIEHVPLRLP
jgi:hypothetical protein